MKPLGIAVSLMLGELLLGCALLVPAHFLAVDSAVVALTSDWKKRGLATLADFRGNGVTP